MMREEEVTKNILRFLIDRQWQIVCYDFPQSGTGKPLHPNGATSKNEGVIIPDVVAVRAGIALYLENKDRYYYPDYQKVQSIIRDNKYSDDFSKLFAGFNVTKMIAGIGLPTSKYVGDAVANCSMVDIVLCVDDDGTVHISHAKPESALYSVL